MGSFRRDRVFDPTDLEIIDRVYEAAWARVETDIFRDIGKDDERKTARYMSFGIVAPMPFPYGPAVLWPRLVSASGAFSLVRIYSPDLTMLVENLTGLGVSGGPDIQSQFPVLMRQPERRRDCPS